MPDVPYAIYRRASVTGPPTLVELGEVQAGSARGAVRVWHRNASPEERAAVEGATLMVVPTRHQHELEPVMETQTRLRF